jgi:hypothetical protein
MKLSALVGAALQLATLAAAGPIDIKANEQTSFLIYGVRLPLPPPHPSNCPVPELTQTLIRRASSPKSPRATRMESGPPTPTLATARSSASSASTLRCRTSATTRALLATARAACTRKRTLPRSIASKSTPTMTRKATTVSLSFATSAISELTPGKTSLVQEPRQPPC